MTVPLEQVRFPSIVFSFSSRVLALRRTDPATLLDSTSIRRGDDELLTASVPPMVLPGHPKAPSGSPSQNGWADVRWSKVTSPVIAFPQMVGPPK